MASDYLFSLMACCLPPDFFIWSNVQVIPNCSPLPEPAVRFYISMLTHSFAFSNNSEHLDSAYCVQDFCRLILTGSMR